MRKLLKPMTSFPNKSSALPGVAHHQKQTMRVEEDLAAPDPIIKSTSPGSRDAITIVATSDLQAYTKISVARLPASRTQSALSPIKALSATGLRLSNIYLGSFG